MVMHRCFVTRSASIFEQAYPVIFEDRFIVIRGYLVESQEVV